MFKSIFWLAIITAWLDFVLMVDGLLWWKIVIIDFTILVIFLLGMSFQLEWILKRKEKYVRLI